MPPSEIPTTKPKAAKSRTQGDASAAESGDDLMKMTVAELREQCRALGLKVGGVKSELQERLLEAMTSANAM